MELTADIETTHYLAQGRLSRLGNYYRWILRNFDGAIARRVWDAGAGIGNVTALLAERAEFLLATEFTEANLETLRARFASRKEVRVSFCDLTCDDALAFAEHRLDTVITLDVLEHLEDDTRALSLFHTVLRRGGRLCIKVPAHPFLYGSMDEASLHYRRYTKRDLRRKLQSAGFVVERIRHMNMAAVFPYVVKGRVLKRRTNFSNAIDDSRLGLYDRVMPWLERAEKVLPTPFGLSLVAVGRKEVTSAG